MRRFSPSKALSASCLMLLTAVWLVSPGLRSILLAHSVAIEQQQNNSTTDSSERQQRLDLQRQFMAHQLRGDLQVTPQTSPADRSRHQDGLTHSEILYTQDANPPLRDGGATHDAPRSPSAVSSFTFTDGLAPRADYQTLTRAVDYSGVSLSLIEALPSRARDGIVA